MNEIDKISRKKSIAWHATYLSSSSNIPSLMPDVVMHLFVNPLEINKGSACFDLRDQKG